MKRLVLASLFLILTASGVPGTAPEAPKTVPVTLNGHTFTLPPGFEIELAAGPPLVDRPITADFDEQGRLYVTEAHGGVTREDVAQKKPMHRIVRLEDTDGDGKFDKSVVFADKMLFPEGTMWYRGSLYVAAPPSIWKLTDTNNDGVADQRVEWFEGKTLTGCANDLHGPYLGPDGWIYWAKGAFAKQTYDRPGKAPFVTRAAHVFRCRPDGSGIEPVMTGGMDNPVDVVFTPGGERIFTTTFFQHPGGGQRDGLIHAVYGGIYGKNHDPIHEHKWTSPHLMPVLTHMGAAAPCGLHRYESNAFGADYQDNLFACQFNLQKVSRHVLTPDGASFKSRDEDFVVSSNRDFHPTDVLEDADGSLLVIDTGGWYKLCCPTSQLVKADILGGIYRIRKKGAEKMDDPRGLKLDWAKMPPRSLRVYFGNDRPAVRWRAVQELADRGPAGLSGLADVFAPTNPFQHRQRLYSVWTLCRIDHADARTLLRRALDDREETVRLAAIHAVSVVRDRDAVPQLMKLLKARSLPHRRAAAEALGRIGDKAAVPTLLEVLAESADRALETSLIYALIEIADREGTAVGLKSDKGLVRRAAMIALDQMDGGKLEAKTVAAELSSADAPMKEAAWWIVGRHPEWGGTLAGVIRERLAAKDMKPAERDELVKQLAQMSRSPATQELLAERLRDAEASREARQTILRAMAQAGLREAPEAWITAVIPILASEDAELLREAVSAARSLRVPKAQTSKLADALRPVGINDKVPATVRLTALSAMPGGLTKVEPPLVNFLRDQLKPTQPVATRVAAADVLGKAKLTSDQLLALTESLKIAGPMETDRLLDAFTSSTDEKVGLALIAALKASPARANLRVETLKPRLAKFNTTVQKQAEELYAALAVDTAKQKEKLEELLTLVKDGDVRRGQAVFNSPKAACSACHAIGYLGGNTGPDLTRIGQVRNERDLLEAIVFPSASLVRSYESVLIATKDGKTHNGLIRKDAPDEIVLATAANQEIRIARGDIEEIQPSNVSIMPAGLDQQLTPQELADLVAFLKACK